MSPATVDPVVGTFNVHAGVDEWGRRFDVLAACRAIDADVLVLQEDWAPDAGPGVADLVAQALGYQVLTQPMAPARRAGPDPEANDRWAPPNVWLTSSRTLVLEGPRPPSPSITESERFRSAEPGRVGIAVLSRLPILDHQVLDLGRLRRDRAHRFALVVRVDAGGTPLTVVGTHMSHLTQGSLRQFRRLRRSLADRRIGVATPAVLAGDMNLWGPPVGWVLRGWRRTVRQRTWPAWRPHSQLDHLLLAGPVTLLEGAVLPAAGSDHRAVRVRLRLG